MWHARMDAPSTWMICAGDMLRIVAVSGDEAAGRAPPAQTDITTIVLARMGTAASDPANCVASEPETWTAFSILSGVPSEALAGEQVLVDQNAWLRAAWRPGEPGRLDESDRRSRLLLPTYRAHPIAADAAGGHVHHH